MGIGMIIVCSLQQVARIVSVLPHAKVIGKTIEKEDKERIIID
jgi:phosphoribosylaminoimidazole (AIR) synthetase